jgi:NADPH:quinone reductase-like Zn-dependent oxidoreductase
MQALILHDSPEERVCIDDVPKPTLQTGDALIRLQAAALNHRDEWIRKGQYGKLRYGAILGSDGCGIVEQVASESDEHWLGKEVIINPSLAWGANPRVQDRAYHILGMPSNGTFAEYCAVLAENLHLKPQHLSSAEAAALPLAGLTAFRAVTTHGEVSEGQNVLVTGIGGGVAQFAAQFALALGARVYCTSGDEAKLQRAREMGVHGGVNYKTQNWHKNLLAEAGEFDVVIDSAAGDSIDALLGLLVFGGKYVFYGATNGRPSTLNVQMIFWKQLRLQGSTMGNNSEFAEMLRLVDAKKITPIVDSVRSFTDITGALDAMARGEQFGKLVVTFP